MSVEIRILSGAHAGKTKKFDDPVIVVGRHATSMLRFDPQHDLDVSGLHAEIRHTDGHYVVHDTKSTNGTFVNGQRVVGQSDLKDGDRIMFGAKGPEVEIRLPGARKASLGASTEQRVAIAVSQQTQGLKRMMIGLIVLVVLGGTGAVYYSKHAASQRMVELNKILIESDSLKKVLQAGIPRASDSALMNAIQAKITELQRRLPAATNEQERTQIAAEINQNQTQLRRMIQMDLPAIHARNSPAVAILVMEIDGKAFAGTGFSISPKGVIVTNRHNVRRESDGKLPSRIAVKFTETRDWLPARVVKVSDEDDIAIIEMEREGTYPVVDGVASSSNDASEGMSVVAIGYPSGMDTPMEGSGNNFLAKSSLNAGTVSKKTSAVLQIDSYATHGSSGSPVFNARGFVVGVVYGGQAEAGGKIVYAVPAERIAAFIPAEYRSILRD